MSLVVAGGAIPCYFLFSILPPFKLESKIDGDEIKITKRKGLYSTVSYITNPRENKIEISDYNFFCQNYGSTILTDKNKDTLVDIIEFKPKYLADEVGFPRQFSNFLYL